MDSNIQLYRRDASRALDLIRLRVYDKKKVYTRTQILHRYYDSYRT